MEWEPPLQDAYQTLLEKSIKKLDALKNNSYKEFVVVEECDLPLIDLSLLSKTNSEREYCKQEIVRASREWGFFLVVNHGISSMILEKMRCEQIEVFKKPFHVKQSNCMTISASCYRWGSPTATCLDQLSWSEVFHIPLSDVSGFGSSLSSAIEQFATVVTDLGQKLIEILAEKLGHDSTFFQKHCSASSCYLRMNRYPPCPLSSQLVHGLIPHTDSDFLTILHQDHISGLQLMKDGRWFKVKPNPQSLIINIGDLLQAWSNNFYKSVQHRVVTNRQEERFSTAYFVCPFHEAVIHSCTEPAIYRKFSFGEYKKQTEEDVKRHGYKIGLSRFLVENNPK